MSEPATIRDIENLQRVIEQGFARQDANFEKLNGRVRETESSSRVLDTLRKEDQRAIASHDAALVEMNEEGCGYGAPLHAEMKRRVATLEATVAAATGSIPTVTGDRPVWKRPEVVSGVVGGGGATLVWAIVEMAKAYLAAPK